MTAQIEFFSSNAETLVSNSPQVTKNLLYLAFPKPEFTPENGRALGGLTKRGRERRWSDPFSKPDLQPD